MLNNSHQRSFLSSSSHWHNEKGQVPIDGNAKDGGSGEV